MKLKSLWPVGARRLVRSSSFLNVGLNRSDRITKHVSKATLAAGCFVVGCGITPLSGEVNRFPQRSGVSNITLNQGSFSQDVWSHGRVTLPNSLVVSSIRSLQGVTAPNDELPENSAAEVGFTVEDGLTGSGVSVLGEQVRDKSADQDANNRKSEADPLGPVDQSVCEVWCHGMVGGVVGILVGVPLLILLLKFLTNDERMHPYQRGRASITGLRFKSG
jgi:hypothetical protein